MSIGRSAARAGQVAMLIHWENWFCVVRICVHFGSVFDVSSDLQSSRLPLEVVSCFIRWYSLPLRDDTSQSNHFLHFYEIQPENLSENNNRGNYFFLHHFLEAVNDFQEEALRREGDESAKASSAHLNARNGIQGRVSGRWWNRNRCQTSESCGNVSPSPRYDVFSRKICHT